LLPHQTDKSKKIQKGKTLAQDRSVHWAGTGERDIVKKWSGERWLDHISYGRQRPYYSLLKPMSSQKYVVVGNWMTDINAGRYERLFCFCPVCPAV
jgi:hypothetical protein